MKKELKINVAVIAEIRKSKSHSNAIWAEDYWMPSSVIYGHVNHEIGDVIRQTEMATAYFMGHSEIYCHAKETESYIHNFESEVPAIYVVLRRDEEDEHPIDYFVHAVTVSPYEAQDYADPAEDIIERVPMPTKIAVMLMDFIDQHHVDEPFKKRKRKNYKQEPHQFGKDPIFQNMSAQRWNGLDQEGGKNDG